MFQEERISLFQGKGLLRKGGGGSMMDGILQKSRFLFAS